MSLNQTQWDSLHNQSFMLLERLARAWQHTQDLLQERQELVQHHQELILQRQRQVEYHEDQIIAMKPL